MVLNTDLHKNHFTDDWQDRIELLEYNQQHNNFDESWRVQIKEINHTIQLLTLEIETVSSRGDKRYDRLNESLKKLNNLLQSFVEIKVSTGSNKLK